MNKLALSCRLKSIVALVDKCECVIDIGCDHGKVLAALFLENIIDHAIATDISAPSVQKTKDLLTQLGLIDRCEIVVGDGFENVRANCLDCAIIAGMGGREIMKIMSACSISISTWVLQPMSDEEALRTYLTHNGFCITKDQLLMDKGKYYTILKVERGRQRLDRLQRKFGTDYKNDKVLGQYVQQELEKIESYLLFASKKSKAQLKKRYKELQKVARRKTWRI